MTAASDAKPVVRLAFFEGTIKPGREREFDRFIEDELLPLWRSFPNLSSLQVMRRCDSVDGAAPHALILAFTYPSYEAMQTALDSAVRAESREVTKRIFTLFEGRIFHIVSLAAEQVRQTLS